MKETTTGKYIPRIRIQRITMDNFKGVEHGVIEFNCYKDHTRNDLKADILGLYGQNGSGKTTLIDALLLLQDLINTTGNYAEDFHVYDVINRNADHAHLQYSFLYENEDETYYSVDYDVSLRNQSSVLTGPDDSYEYEVQIPFVCDEVLSLSGCFNGQNVRRTAIMDTRSEYEVFLPKSWQKRFFPADTDAHLRKLNELKGRLKEAGSSCVFSFIHPFMEDNNLYTDIVVFLESYITNFLFVSSHKIEANESLRLQVGKDEVYYSGSLNKGAFGYKNLHRDSTFSIYEGWDLPGETMSDFERWLSGLNTVLPRIIPDMTIKYIEQDGVKADSRMISSRFQVFTTRNGIDIPIREEAEGIQRVISNLSLYLSAFANDHVTVLIDEFDAGVYEFLLGELLSVFQEHGKGQLIFTSHNLRPLEVLDHKFICFTTANPANRYFRLKNVRERNNLRDVYLREIILGRQSEELYEGTRRGKLVAALLKAGELYKTDSVKLYYHPSEEDEIDET